MIRESRFPAGSVVVTIMVPSSLTSVSVVVWGSSGTGEEGSVAFSGAELEGSVAETVGAAEDGASGAQPGRSRASSKNSARYLFIQFSFF
jgi:hypothetical protein